MTTRLTVRGEILRWARESAGFTVSEAAEKLHLPESRLTDWEATSGDPTPRQLDELARVYRRCTDVFFMPAPPKKERPRPTDFRTYFDHRFRKRLTSATFLAIREAQDMQVRYGNLRRLLGTKIPLRLPHLTFDDNPDDVAGRMRELLDVSLEEQRRWQNEYRALRTWRQAIEGWMLDNGLDETYRFNEDSIADPCAMRAMGLESGLCGRR